MHPTVRHDLSRPSIANAIALCAVTVCAIMSMQPAAAPALGAQQASVPTVVLQNPREVDDPFTIPQGFSELRDGRILVADQQEKSISLVDAARGSRSAAARSGSGPTEFGMGTVLTSFADSAYVYDVQQRRLLIFSPTGTPIGTRPWGGGDRDPMAMFSAMLPTIVDASGRFYGQTIGVVMPARADLERGAAAGNVPMPTFSDSVSILRLDPRTGRTDTVARIRSAIAGSAPKVELVGSVMRMTVVLPDLKAHDVWTALPGGGVAILRDGKYQVELVALNGLVTRGPTIPFTPVRVTAAERRAIADSTRASFATVRERMGHAAQATGATDMPAFDINLVEPASWAQVKPAYVSLHASPDGRLWVQTSKLLSEATTTYDVLDARGALTARVRLPAGETLLGLGRGAVYTTRKDADDFYYVRRYALPPSVSR